MLIAKIDDPAIDVAHYEQQLKMMADEIREQFGDGDDGNKRVTCEGKARAGA